MISIKNLSFAFENKDNIIEHLDLDVKENEVVLITGNSGCGKSALLMCMARVVPEIVEGTISGDIFFKGESILDKSAVDVSEDMAYMFQDPDSQLCTFTVKDELVFGLENIGIPKNDMDILVNEVLEYLGIKALENRNLNELSGGEKQKVALASLLVMKPKCLLLDEPTANLDPNSSKEIIHLLKKLKKDFNMTIIIVEHNIKYIESFVDRVYKFKDKKIIELDKYDFFRNYIKDAILPTNNNSKDKIIQNETILKVEDLSFYYQNKDFILKNASFEIKRGDICGIIGKNGVGKSTLCKLLMGLLKPISGDIKINGQSILKMKPKLIGENMGLVFQNPEHQFIKMTVEKEISFGLEQKGLIKSNIDSKVDEFLVLFDLKKQMKDNPFTLSQGQKRRLSTASMLIQGQQILILDEPTYGQDFENLLKLVNLIYEINKEGITVIIITHDMDFVNNCCNKVAEIKDGSVFYVGY